MTHPNLHTTARRNLAHRIGRFLDALNKADLSPDYWESMHVLQALECLEVEEFPRGERAMMAAERQPQSRSTLVGVNSKETVELPTTPQLRAKLEEILRGVA